MWFFWVLFFFKVTSLDSIGTLGAQSLACCLAVRLSWLPFLKGKVLVLNCRVKSKCTSVVKELNTKHKQEKKKDPHKIQDVKPVPGLGNVAA